MMATELFGSLAASFARRCAYSKAVIPGVTGKLGLISTYVFQFVVRKLKVLTFTRFQEVRVCFMHRLSKLEVGSGD